MDILIKNMEMPTKINHPLFIRIKSDGHIAKGDFLKGGFIETEAKAIEVPPHGRCIDADELEASDAILVGKEAWDMVHNAPTVLEASNGTDN